MLGENGWHGFAYPLTYQSVPALVEYYGEKSLAEYNPSLDVKLLYPVPDPKKVCMCTENGEYALKCGRLHSLSVCTAVQLKQKVFCFLFNMKQLAGIVCPSIIVCGKWTTHTGVLW